PLTLRQLVEQAQKPYLSFKGQPGAELEPYAFWDERLRYVLEQRGAQREHVRAVQAADNMSPLAARRKVEALPEFAGSPAFKQLATTFKRVKNIARELKNDRPLALEDLSAMLKEPSESYLVRDLAERLPRARAAASK